MSLKLYISCRIILGTLAILTAMVCTSSSFRIRGRVVGGQRAERGQFPYAVALLLELELWNGTRQKGACTGSILTANWILTAAHCAVFAEYKLIKMQYIAGQIQMKAEYVKEITEVIPHKEYRNVSGTPDDEPTQLGRFIENDICLAKTTEKMKFSKFVSPVCLFSGKVMSYDCLTVGFGSLSNPGEKEEVANRFLFYGPMIRFDLYPIADTITFVTVFTYPSSGDSGGPIMCGGQQTGVASMAGAVWHVAIAIYTNPTHYSSWIKKYVHEDLFNKTCQKKQISATVSSNDGVKARKPYNFIHFFVTMLFVIGQIYN